MDNFGFCRECGKVKENKNFPLCNACYDYYEEEFKLIREYLKKHGKANAIEVSKGTDIAIDRIMQFVRDGLIQITGK